jgi:hypothetical protein
MDTLKLMAVLTLLLYNKYMTVELGLLSREMRYTAALILMVLLSSSNIKQMLH